MCVFVCVRACVCIQFDFYMPMSVWCFVWVFWCVCSMHAGVCVHTYEACGTGCVMSELWPLSSPQHVEEQIKLLRHQRRLEDEMGQSFVDTSLQATLHKLTLEGAHMSADKLRKEFKVPDKRCNFDCSVGVLYLIV